MNFNTLVSTRKFYFKQRISREVVRAPLGEKTQAWAHFGHTLGTLYVFLSRKVFCHLEVFVEEKSDKNRSGGAGTRTPDTRIMIPVL